MKFRHKRLLLGCLGPILIFCVVLFLANLGLSQYYRHKMRQLGREMAARGYPGTFQDLLAAQTLPPNQRNGVEVFQTALHTLKIDRSIPRRIPDLHPPTMGNIAHVRIGPEQFQAIKSHIDRNREALSLLKSAADSDACKLQPQFDKNGGLINLAPWPEIGHAAQLLAWNGVYAAYTGDRGSAVDALETLVKLETKFVNQPFSFTDGASYTMAAWASDEINLLFRLQCPWSPDELERLAAAAAASECRDETYGIWSRILEVDESKPWGSPHVAYKDHPIASKVIGNGEIVFDAVMHAIGRIVHIKSLRDGNPSEKVVNFLVSVIYRHTFCQEYDRYRCMQAIIARSRVWKEPLHDYSSRLKALGISEPLLTQYYGTEGDFRSQVGGIVTPRLQTTAFRVLKFKAEHGHWPSPDDWRNSAKASADPFDGELLRYKVTARGFSVYSVGWDGKDEGGVYEYQHGQDDIALEYPPSDSGSVRVEILPLEPRAAPPSPN